MTSPTTASTPYSSVAALLPSTAPSWLPTAVETQRFLSYQVYEDIYWNNPNAFKLVQRGSEDNPIYIPSGRVIVETINRYVARDMDFKLMPGVGTAQQQEAATLALTALINRERFWSKFAAAKRYGIIRGDWIFHITADPTKPAGSRLSISTIDPWQYFPILNPDDVDDLLGCDIVEQVEFNDKVALKRHRYLKTERGTISSETLIVDPENWNTDRPKVLQSLVPVFELPADITALPVYHIKNFETPRVPYGSSELRGLEHVIAGINQSVSDEDITLAMEGLGCYVTDAGSPVDEDGNDVNWRLGPGRVVEVPEGSNFNRVNGVNTVGPYQEHLSYLHRRLDESSAASDVAKGSVDVTVAQSGIALQLRFGPILDLASEKDIIIKDVMRNFIYDIRAWFKAYEQIDMSAILWDVHMGPKLPPDIEKEADFYMALASGGFLSVGTLHEKLRELGYDIPEGELANMVAEQNTLAQAGLAAGADNTQQVGNDLAAEAAGATPAPDPVANAG